MAELDVDGFRMDITKIRKARRLRGALESGGQQITKSAQNNPRAGKPDSSVALPDPRYLMMRKDEV